MSRFESEANEAFAENGGKGEPCVYNMVKNDGTLN